MQFVSVESFDEWRKAARDALHAETTPDAITFREQRPQQLLFDDRSRQLTQQTRESRASRPITQVPREFVESARRVACHREAHRFDLLYRVLWRLAHGEEDLLEITTDDDVAELRLMDKAVRRDAHKMKAFVRFRRLSDSDGAHFVAWHQPDHRVLGLTAPFFARRFANMNWAIFTPHESASWNAEQLQYGPGVPKSQVPANDELDELWRTYYAAIFNPARVKTKAMVREMPVRYWHTLPETTLIPDLVRAARPRVREMVEHQPQTRRSAANYLPPTLSIDSLRQAARCCEGCDLYRDATQTVFGAGNANARLMLVGEQPGDEEDRRGRPFVGPAGRVLDEALEAAGIERAEVYVTNAVKHFKFVSRGKRRLHKKPGAREMAACSAWLHAELNLVQPDFLLCLGATAAQALIGRSLRITQQRGQIVSTEWCDATMATYHPSAVLRAGDDTHREEIRAHLVDDLKTAAMHLV